MNRRRDLLLGCLGAALMLVGDLCLSLIPAASTDSGLFVREAYLNGSYQTWRLPLLLGAQVQTIDFVLSQCSGNGAVMLWMLEDYLWERKHKNG